MTDEKLGRADQEFLGVGPSGFGFQLISPVAKKVAEEVQSGVRKDVLVTAAKTCPTCAEEVLKMEGLAPLD
ncbi:MAG: hypothetical protein K9L85_02905 [Candidatus Peribacteraceae bacterium]|nr:hypothetical protein [Candidatus Peribacteraceae bacterium]